MDKIIICGLTGTRVALAHIDYHFTQFLLVCDWCVERTLRAPLDMKPIIEEL